MQKSPPNLDIEETSFPNAWARAVRFVMNFGMVLPTEYDNSSKDVCSRITLTGNAIKQIEKMELHPQFPTKKSHLKEYIIQFTRQYNWKKQGFEYTYMNRLSNYHNIDQLELLKNNIPRVGSRRLIAITWRPEQDWNTEHPPCLQLIWVRRLKDKLVEVHLTWRCYDEKTDILTSNGWKNFSELKYSDKVATLGKNNNIEYYNPSKIFKYRYNGEMIHFGGKKVDLLVTPNHKMYVRKYGETDYKFVDAIKCSNNNTIISKKCNWEGIEQKLFKLPSITYKHRVSDTKKIDIEVPMKSLNMDDWLRFFGWWISEGNTHVNNRSYNTLISQKKNIKYKKEIENIIKKLGFKYHLRSDKNSYEISNKQLYTYLSQFGLQQYRYVPEYIKHLSKRQITIFLRALFKGDGHKQLFDEELNWIKNNHNEYLTSSKKLADDIQELLFKIGFQSTLSSFQKRIKSGELRTYYRIRISNYDESWITTKEKEYYNGLVYCCEVPNNIIMVRRNGIIHWCGNSRDLFSAWMSNIIAIVDMLNREVLKPNSLRIIKLVDFCNSLHIYDRDWESAKKVRLVPVNPQELR